MKFHASQRVELQFDGGPKTSQILSGDIVVGGWSKAFVRKNKIASAHGSLRLPVYTVSGFPHPRFEGRETQLGIDVDECLFEYYASDLGFFPGTKERVLTSAGAWYQLHPEIAPDGKKFYAKHWPEILEKYPRLSTLLYEEFEE